MAVIEHIIQAIAKTDQARGGLLAFQGSFLFQLLQGMTALLYQNRRFQTSEISIIIQYNQFVMLYI
jgi:hypothetical protein